MQEMNPTRLMIKNKKMFHSTLLTPFIASRNVRTKDLGFEDNQKPWYSSVENAGKRS